MFICEIKPALDFFMNLSDLFNVYETINNWLGRLYLHPQYNPKLALTVFYLFGQLKDMLCGMKFHDNNRSKKFPELVLISTKRFHYSRLIQKWDKCFNVAGDYVGN